MVKKERVLISVIVVTYNAGRKIEDTLRSLYGQTMRDYEVIFIDGNSTDDTKQILKKYINYFSDIRINTQLISEPDKGIYDAMNKGIKLAKGIYGYFLNAGDLIYDPLVFKDIAEELNGAIDVIYGDIVDDYGYKREILKAKKADDIRFIMPFCHQAVFTRLSLLKQNLYDITYCYCADYDMYLKMYLEHKSFVHCHKLIVIYSREGVSSNNTVEVLRQYKNIQKKYKIYSFRQAEVYLYRIFLHYLRLFMHKIRRHK